MDTDPSLVYDDDNVYARRKREEQRRDALLKAQQQQAESPAAIAADLAETWDTMRLPDGRVQALERSRPQPTPNVTAPLHIEVVPDAGGYFASVVEWPGCMTQADTLPDLFAMLPDAMAAWQSVAVTQATPPAAMPSPTQAFDTLRAQFGRHFANWQPPEPDPIRHLIPPLDQWPEDAVAWMVEKDGCTVYLLPDVDGAAWETREAWTDDGSHPIFVPLPRGYDWRASLRLRPQGA